MRELSDKVVEWQELHKEVSQELVAQKLRAAQLQTEHDKLIGMIKELMAAQKAQEQQLSNSSKTARLQIGRRSNNGQKSTPSQPQRSSSAALPSHSMALPLPTSGGKASAGPSRSASGSTSKGRMGFLHRLKTPRNRDQ